MAVKKFVPRSQTKKVAPIEFEVYGKKFKASGTLQGLTLINFMSSAHNISSGEDADPEKTSLMLKDIMPFFESVLYPDSYKEFREMASNPETILEIEDYVDIISYLLEQYTSRPTPES